MAFKRISGTIHGRNRLHKTVTTTSPHQKLNKIMNPTTQCPTYELLKDLPDYKAGEIFKWHEGLECYAAETPDSFGEVGKWPARFVENNVDWFRRVEVKDWEVVKSKSVQGGFHDYDEKLCKEFCCTIHSVRRLSDGETFTVGEYMTYDGISPHSWSDDNSYGCPIKSFTIHNEYIYINNHHLNQRKNINQWVKLPSPPVEQETIKVEIEEMPLLSLNDIKDMYDSPKESPLFLRLYSKLYAWAEFKNKKQK